MNIPEGMHPSAPSPKVLADAERWFARLMTGECSAVERAEFARWQAVPEHAVAYADTERLWNEIHELAGNEELERMSAEALAATRPRPAPSVRRRTWRLPVALAASVAVCAIAATVVMVLDRTPPPVVYATVPGERNTVTLEDGSQVFLNTDTAVAVSLGKGARELRLDRGEALFEVEPDPRRPFRVKAGGSEVTALGTRFQVRKQDERITVTLLEGSVAMGRSVSSEQLRLSPGEQATFAGERGRITRRVVDTDVVTSWTRGRLLFRATPLAEVIEQVNRYADTKLRLADPSLGGIPVSGTFPIGDSASVAAGLQALLPVRAVPGPANEILLQRRRGGT